MKKKVHKWKLELLEPLSKSDTKRIPEQEIPTQRQLSTTDSFFRGDTNKGRDRREERINGKRE